MNIEFIQKIKEYDELYSILLLKSILTNDNRFFINEFNITYTSLSKEIKKSDKTISKHFKKLITNGILEEGVYLYNKGYYINTFYLQDKINLDIIYKLLKYHCKGLIQAYLIFICLNNIYCLNETNIEIPYSNTLLIKDLGYTPTNTQAFDRARKILSILQKEEIIQGYRIEQHRNPKGQMVGPKFYITKISV